MENKQTKENEAEDVNVNEDGGQEDVTKITLKNQKPAGKNSEDIDANWKKVESIMSAAKEVYQSGKSNFNDVMESTIATLQDLMASEADNSSLGGLYGGPQMNIPAESDSKQESQQ